MISYFFSLSKKAIAASRQVFVNIRKDSASNPTGILGIGFTVIRETTPNTKLMPANTNAQSEAFFIPASFIQPVP